MAKKCRKCGYERKATDVAPTYECPKCGAIYAKVEAAMKNASCNAKADNSEVAKNRKLAAEIWDIDLKYLQKGEEIEYADRPSMLCCIVPSIWIGLMVFTSIWIVILRITEDESAQNVGGFVFGYMLLAVPGIYVLLKQYSTRFAITTRGLIKRTGIITTNIKTIPFKHITSIEVKETLTGKLLGYAHLLIDTSGSGQAIEFRWDYIKAAYNVKKLIEKHLGE